MGHQAVLSRSFQRNKSYGGQKSDLGHFFNATSSDDTENRIVPSLSEMGENEKIMLRFWSQVSRWPLISALSFSAGQINHTPKNGVFSLKYEDNC